MAHHLQEAGAGLVSSRFNMRNECSPNLPGEVINVVTRGVRLDRVNAPLHLYQTNGGHTSVVKIKHDSR
jgi:hypothetical protein